MTSICPLATNVYADDTYYYGYGNYYDDYDYYNDYNYNDYYNDYYSTTPVITSPSDYDRFIVSDTIRILWEYTGSENCVVDVKDSKGYVSELQGEKGNKVFILPNKLARGETYTVTVKAGSYTSEPVTIKIPNREEEMVEIIDRTEVEKAEPEISRSVILPEGTFDTKQKADNHMKTIKVNVWQLNSRNQKVSKTVSITVNAALADTVTKIFNEIYQNKLHFPIKSVGCYNYRTTASGARLSEHAFGTAIDINPNENYCVYSSGSVVGSFYKPYENQYSVVPEIINIFRKYNFYWGGSFGDYMHFSYFGT